MSATPLGNVVIGVKHVCKEFRGDGLIPRGVYYAREAANVIRRRGADRAARWYIKALTDLARLKKTGKAPKRLREMRVRVAVGNEIVEVPLDRKLVARILKGF